MRALAFVFALFVAAAPATPQSWPSERPPRPLAARDVDFPEYQLRTLPNGLQVVAVLHHEQPVVSMRMLVRAGGASDPKDKLGLAELTAALLTQGTTKQNATEMNDAIDFIGGAMGAGAGNDLTYLNVVVMKDSFQVGLDLLSDMARRPAFAGDEISRQRQQMLSRLRVSYEDPAFIADSVFGRLVYGFHPYGMPQSGTPETMASITRDDLVAHHRRYFVPNNAILAVVGDVTPEEAFDGVERAFGDWARGEVPTPSYTTPPEPTRRVVIVDMPDAVQTEVRIGHLGIRRNHTDYMPLNLATRILGGEGANRLYQVLRTDRGLTYSAQADMHALREAGDFEASTSTRTDATADVVRLIVDEFWKIQREPVGDQELSDAKAYITGSFPLTIETPDVIATQVLNVLFYGLPVEQLETFRDRVNAVTPQDVQRVARFYYKPDRLSVVLVGNARAFTATLRAAGFGQFEIVNIDDLDLSTANLRRPTGKPSESGTFGRAELINSTTEPLLSALIDAKGGVETLRAIRGLKAVTTTEVSTPDGPVQAETTTYLEYPDRVRVETRLPDATVVQVFDGRRGWIQDPNGTREVDEMALRDLRTSLKRDTLAALLAADAGQLRARALPDVRTPDGSTERALEISGEDLEPLVLYVDPRSNLIVRQTFVQAEGQPIIEERFSDYRVVDGVQIAFTAQIRRGGRLVVERRISSIAINPPIEPSLFRRPAS